MYELFVPLAFQTNGLASDKIVRRVAWAWRSPTFVLVPIYVPINLPIVFWTPLNIVNFLDQLLLNGIE